MRAGLAWQKSPQSAGCPNRSFAELDGSWTCEPPCRGLSLSAFMSCSSHWGRGFRSGHLFHIALGRWILEHHTVPTADPFSATLRGTHWVAFEWLSQIAFATAYAVGGWLSVVVLTAAAVSTAFGLMTRFLVREWQPTAVLVAVLAALLLTAPHLLARPHILALPVMVAWIGTLIRAVDTRSPPPWLLLPLMTLWANLHGSFTFGLAMVAPIACDALWRAPHSERWKVIRQWTLFAILAFAAACLNPYGPEMILVTFRTIALGAALTTVTEWRSQDFSHLGGFELVMLGAFGFALYRGVTLPWLRIVMVFGISEPVAGAPCRPARIACSYFSPGRCPNNLQRLLQPGGCRTRGSMGPAAAVAASRHYRISRAEERCASYGQNYPANAIHAIDIAKAGTTQRLRLWRLPRLCRRCHSSTARRALWTSLCAPSRPRIEPAKSPRLPAIAR